LGVLASPAVLHQGSLDDGASFPLYLLQVTALSVAIAWLYWHTGGSLLLTMPDACGDQQHDRDRPVGRRQSTAIPTSIERVSNRVDCCRAAMDSAEYFRTRSG